MLRNKFAMRFFIFMLIPGSIICIGLPKDSLCVTPNGEPARCIGIGSCGVFHEGIALKIPKVLQFLEMSLCGYDKGEPLICCGTKVVESNIVINCVTPNNENATCLPLSSCPLLQNKSKDESDEAKAFLRLSQCGYTQEPHVCCGTNGTFSEPNIFFSHLTKCGMHSASSFYNTFLLKLGHRFIVGGDPLKIGDFPWTVLIHYKYFYGADAGFKCGGSLVSKKYVVTAAHCTMINPLMGYDIDTVRLGEWTISSHVDCEDDICINEAIDLKVVSIAVYPEYNSGQKLHDIALLKLEREVEYTDYIRPICLPTQGRPTPKDGTKMMVTGWGTTENGTTSDTKLYVVLPIVSNDRCSKMLEGWSPITDYHMCAGGEEGKDACQGDSGGPLMGRHYLLGNYQYYLDGVVSWGIQCGAGRYPGIYTKVSMYIDWIISNTQ